MHDREKVIKWFELFIKEFELFIKEIHPVCTGEGAELDMFRDVLVLLKEQEEREKAICKEICDFIRGACSTDTDDDKDFVCYEIQRIFTRS